MRRSPENVRTISTGQLIANYQVAPMIQQSPQTAVSYPRLDAPSVYVPPPN